MLRDEMVFGTPRAQFARLNAPADIARQASSGRRVGDRAIVQIAGLG